MASKRFEGKVALVMGSGSSGPGWGNGKAISVLFGREGANVFGCDINLAAAQETADIIRQEQGRCEVKAADVRSSDEIKAAVDACIDVFGRIDVLVNNVGVSAIGGPVELSEEKWEQTQALNCTYMFLTCKHVIPHMERQGSGSIVNIGSVGGIRSPTIAQCAYESSKAAISGLSRSIAIQYASKQIRSNIVLPGLMNTPVVFGLFKNNYKDADDIIAQRNKMCPMGHMGDAWDIAEAVLFLASDAAKYITATELIVDGGLSARIS